MPRDPTGHLQVCNSLLFFVIAVTVTWPKKVLKQISKYPSLLYPSFRYDTYCADHYGNGICDQSCYTEACGWDGLDCSSDTPPKLVPGILVIVVRLQPKELLGDLRGFLRALGALLHTNLQVKLDKNKEPMVYPYFGVEEDYGRQLQRRRNKRELEKEVIG